MDKETIDLSNVHILALFRQYYAITLSQWRYNHALSHGIIDATPEKSAETNKEYSDAANLFRIEINKRLNFDENDKNDEDYRKNFMAWYSANDKFIKSLSDEEYAKFEYIETNYINGDFKDSTEFNAVLGELKYEEFVAEQLKDTGVTAGL